MASTVQDIYVQLMDQLSCLVSDISPYVIIGIVALCFIFGRGSSEGGGDSSSWDSGCDGGD